MNRSKLRIFINQFGVIIGENEETDIKDQVKLKHPLRFIPHGNGLVAAGLFIKEEWVTFYTQSAMEISLDEAIADEYIKYESEIFSSIVIPKEKKIII